MDGFKDSFTAQPVRARVGKCFQIFVISLPVEGNVLCAFLCLKSCGSSDLWSKTLSKHNRWRSKAPSTYCCQGIPPKDDVCGSVSYCGLQGLQLPKEGRAGSFGMPRATSARADKAPANGDVKRESLQMQPLLLETRDRLDVEFLACIDENLDMVKFLVENGANVNQQDNEGWTPLHAVASCGYLNIAEYLISHGANVAAVNSEGEVPSDIAEEAAMKDLLLEQVKKQGVDLDLARKEEEQQMLQDARQWLNSGRIEDIKQPRTGATALHVAAAKGYSEVMRLLIQAGFNLNVQDNDGWTPLHAAAHWGVKEACSILAEALCDMDIRNKLGQTPFDVADEGLVEHLEMLQKKQTVLRSEKETRNKLIEADMNGKPQSGLFTNKEKILYEEDMLKSMEMEEENKDSSSSSSEEEEEAEEDEVSESDAEKESERKEESFANHSSHETRPSITEQIPPPEPNSFTASARRFSWLNKSDEQKDESPSSWRLGLRKTGSHNMLSEVAATREAQRDKTSLYRSSSSPRISALLDNKEKDKDNKSYLATIAPRRLSSTSDLEEKENRESAVNIVRSGSYTRQPWRDESKGNEAPHSGAPTTYVSTYLKRAPFRQQTDSAVEKSTEGLSASTPLGVITNRAVLGSANGIANAGAASTTGKDFSAEEARERRRSPVVAAGGCKRCFLGTARSPRLLPLLRPEVLNRVIAGVISAFFFSSCLCYQSQSLRPLCIEGQTAQQPLGR
ncbi:Protein phosphatase 1 regulatory subunit 12B [Aix galericulata]|nr:Protein phosphatase 1 regulatory subunit 12B [Aix galericulata]